MNGRVSRWERNKTPEPLVLQSRDVGVMTMLYSYRILTREQIQRLLEWNCTRRVNSRLRKLYDHGYLTRTFIPAVKGSGQAVYYLGPHGTEVVSRELGIDRSLILKKTKHVSQLKELFLAHTLELNDARIAFTQSIDADPGMSLERWITDGECQQDYRVIAGGRARTKRFRPDGYLRFFSNGKLYSFFLELDRSTMSQIRFRTKAENYLEFAREGFYQERFGVRYFRVLVITLTQARLDNLKRTVETITGKVFWFTTLEEITAGNLFNQVWQRAGADGLFRLIG